MATEEKKKGEESTVATPPKEKKKRGRKPGSKKPGTVSAPKPPKEEKPKPPKEVPPPPEPVKTLQDAYHKLSQPFEEEAVERTLGSETGKSYDTTGIHYQYVVNRFNDIFGLDGWSFTYDVQNSVEGQDGSGSYRAAVAVNLTLWVEAGGKRATRTCAGGHTSNNYGDALKGAITNALKKTAALFGAGRQAYEGTIDDDSKAPDSGKSLRAKPGAPAVAAPGPKITDAQLGLVNTLITKKGGDREKLKTFFKVASLKDLTKGQASKLIDSLQARPDAPVAGEAVIELGGESPEDEL